MSGIGNQDQAFGIGGIANQLSQKLDFSRYQVPFFMILGGLGIHLYDFGCPGET